LDKSKEQLGFDLGWAPIYVRRKIDFYVFVCGITFFIYEKVLCNNLPSPKQHAAQ
jgi:hypothetical protein